jgi:hypothetical protein
MSNYTVEWRIEVGAESINEAVLQAIEIMRDPESIAHLSRTRKRRSNITCMGRH